MPDPAWQEVPVSEIAWDEIPLDWLYGGATTAGAYSIGEGPVLTGSSVAPSPSWVEVLVTDAGWSEIAVTTIPWTEIATT